MDNQVILATQWDVAIVLLGQSATIRIAAPQCLNEEEAIAEAWNFLNKVLFPQALRLTGIVAAVPTEP